MYPDIETLKQPQLLAGGYFSPGDIWQCLEIFLGCHNHRMILASSGERPRMFTVHRMAPREKDYPAPNVSHGKMGTLL